MTQDKTIQILKQASRVLDLCINYKHHHDEIPAIAFGIIYKGELIFTKGYGFSDVDKKVPVSEASCYRIASISKIFTTVAIMQLIEAGKLGLDEAISTYIPWFDSKKDEKLKTITIRQLLTHISGITRDGDTLHWVEHQFPDLNHLKEYVSSLVLPFKPGERWKYSNLGFSILGAVVEAVSGETYENYIQVHICHKLGMTSTSSILRDDIEANLVVGRGRRIPGQEREIFPSIETDSMASATGLSSNVSDLLKFVTAFFNGNTSLLSKDSKQEMFKINWNNKKDGISQALGFRTYKSGGRTIFNHSGGFQGYRCNISIDVVRGIGVVTLTNVIGIDPKDFGKLAFNVIDYTLKQPFSPTSQKLEKYEGIFRDIWDDSAVMSIGDTLLSFDPASFVPLSHAAKLEPIKNNVFKITGSDEMESAGELAYFELDEQGQAKRVRWGATYADKLRQ